MTLIACFPDYLGAQVLTAYWKACHFGNGVFDMKMCKCDNHFPSRRSRAKRIPEMATQLTLGLNNTNLAGKLSKAWWGVLVLNKSCIVKVKLPSQKGLKSTIDLYSKKLSSNPAYSRIDINFLTGTTHTLLLDRVSKTFSSALKHFTFQQCSLFHFQAGWKQDWTVKAGGGKENQNHTPPRKQID